MKSKNPEILTRPKVVVHYGYLLAIFFITLSGFAQMPIFKRYYIADIPGLGWLAQFYVTHIIHYLSAALLLGISAYRISEYLLQRRKTFKLSPSGYWRGGLILALMVTGILLVVRNFEGHLYSDNFVIGLVLTHLALVIVFLSSVLACLLFKKKWTISR